MILGYEKNKIDNKTETIHIIAGKWRGKKIIFSNIQGLRPTPSRVRETLFDWLQAKIKYSRCLDLFAGSGALGLEAASRGAMHVDLVEMNNTAVKLLQGNCRLLSANNCQVIESTAQTFLNFNRKDYDIVFLDPPYLDNIYTNIANLLTKNDVLVSNTHIYVEFSRAQNLPNLPTQWKLLSNKLASNMQYCLFINE